MKQLKWVLVTIFLLWLPASAQETIQNPPRLDVNYVPTSKRVVDAMLKLAKVKKTDKVYDLGCGDGRIVITAAKKHGASGLGIDLNPVRIAEANANAEKAGVSGKVKFVEADLFTSDFRDATVVMLYLLPQLNLRLRPVLLEQLKPGTRVISHKFDMGDWKPDETRTVDGVKIYLWTIPASKKITNL